MKKILALLLTTILVASLFAGCGANEPVDPQTRAYETYANLMQLMAVGAGQSGAYDVDMVMEMTMDIEGETMNMTSTGNMVMIADGDHIQSSMTMEMDMGEIDGVPIGTMTMELHMEVDGTEVLDMRLIVDGDEIPSEFLPQDMMEAMFEDALNMPNVSEGMFVSVEIEEIGGNTAFHIVLDGEMLTEFTSQMLDGMMDGMMLGVDMDIASDNMNMTILTDSVGNPISMTMEMNMQMEVDGEEATIHALTTMTFNAFGDDVDRTAA